MKGFIGGILIGTGFYLAWLDYKSMKANENWKVATTDERSGQEAS